MSQINYIINFFLPSNKSKISVQKLYKLYKLYFTKNSNVTFRQFCINFNTFFKTTQKHKTALLFLAVIFFHKTSPTLQVNQFRYRFQVEKKQSQLISTITDLNFENIKWIVFWAKWKKLIRPEISEKDDEGFFKNFTKRWDRRIATYEKLGFIKVHDLYPYILRAKTETFKQILVVVDKPLLTTPKFSSSSIAKLISLDKAQNFEFQFLRKNKVYNKGRYSRCRQNYRTGVYMCMYLSVVSIFGLYYWFFKFSFNFTYLWWLFITFVGSFFLPKIIKYRLYEPITLLNKFFDFFRWLFLVIKSVFF